MILHTSTKNKNQKQLNSLIIRSFSYSFSFSFFLALQALNRSRWFSHINQVRHLNKYSSDRNAISHHRSYLSRRFWFISYEIYERMLSRFCHQAKTNSLFNSSKKLVMFHNKSFSCVIYSSVSWYHWIHQSLNVWYWLEHYENASFK